jgi:hypothetical protein
MKAAESKNYGGDLPHETLSVCPECKRVLKAIVLEDDGKVFIERTCPVHGNFKEVYWENAAYYRKMRKFACPANKIDNPNTGFIGENGKNCPFDCGLCSNHKSHTGLANIALTNRCDLSCWYCFFYCKEGEPIYEPSLELIDKMLLNLRKEKPVATNAIQLTGGEPTLREDLPEIIRLCRKRGFEQVQLNTTGIALGFRKGLAEKVAKAGSGTIYMSFDGTTKKTNPKNHWEVPFTLKECEKAGLGIVMVPTLIKGINDSEMGSIINFGLNNLKTVRGVNFQPVSFVGRISKKERDKQRITIPKALELIEEQTNGVISMQDFYVVPSIHSISRFVEAFTKQKQYDLSVHFACGAATYVFLDGKKVIPITRFIDVEGLFEFLDEQSQELEKGGLRPVVAGKTLLGIGKFIDKGKQPSFLDFKKLIFNVLVRHDFTALGKVHEKSMLIGMMHFMDPYNYDIERVQRCDIHYAMPDGRIVPFCSFNVHPEIYRDKVQRQYSVSWKQWQKQNSGKNPNEKYKRDIQKLEGSETYKKCYNNLTDYFGK